MTVTIILPTSKGSERGEEDERDERRSRRRKRKVYFRDGARTREPSLSEEQEGREGAEGMV